MLKLKAVPHIDTLVIALNEAPPSEQCRWLEAAIEWFESLAVDYLDKVVHEYRALARI